MALPARASVQSATSGKATSWRRVSSALIPIHLHHSLFTTFFTNHESSTNETQTHKIPHANFHHSPVDLSRNSDKSRHGFALPASFIISGNEAEIESFSPGTSKISVPSSNCSSLPSHQIFQNHRSSSFLRIDWSKRFSIPKTASIHPSSFFPLSFSSSPRPSARLAIRAQFPRPIPYLPFSILKSEMTNRKSKIENHPLNLGRGSFNLPHLHRTAEGLGVFPRRSLAPPARAGVVQCRCRPCRRHESPTLNSSRQALAPSRNKKPWHLCEVPGSLSSSSLRGGRSSRRSRSILQGGNLLANQVTV